MAGMAARVIAVLLSTPIMIRSLGLSAFGSWILLLTLVGLAGLAELGFTTGVAVFMAAERRSPSARRAILRQALVLVSASGLSVTVAWGLLSPALGSRVAGLAVTGDWVTASRVLALGLLPRLWQSLLVSWEAAVNRFDAQVIIEAGAFVLLNSGLAILALIDGRYWLLATWYLVITSAAVVAHVWALRLDLAELLAAPVVAPPPGLTRFSLFQWVSSLGSTIFSKADRLAVNAVVGPSGLALYAAGVSVASKLNELCAVPLQPTVPAISEARGREANNEARQIVMDGLYLNVTMVFGIGTTMMWLSPWIAAYLSPSRTGELTQLICILVLAYASYSSTVVGYFAAQALKLSMANGVALLAGGVGSVLLIWMLPAVVGLMGVAWGNFGFSLAYIPLYVVLKKLGITVREVRKPYLASAALLITSFAIVTTTEARNPLWNLFGWVASVVTFAFVVPNGARSVLALLNIFRRVSAKP